MEDRTIEVRDHRLYLRAGDTYVYYTRFTAPDSFEEFREPLGRLGFDVANKIKIAEGNECLSGFKLKRPTLLEISRLTGERSGFLSVHTSGYEGSRRVLEEVAEELGLITDFPSEAFLDKVKKWGSYYAKQNESTRAVYTYSKRSFEDSFGALTYAAFLMDVQGLDSIKSIHMAGEAYGFNLEEALNSMCRQD
ncbi:MAG: hypothetical protein Q7R87_04415 [Nanoarchaeota archaeon]|nr:hypothetical protein [Nanoarchaeota archaeon]